MQYKEKLSKGAALKDSELPIMSNIQAQKK